jgi:hypothetical protein
MASAAPARVLVVGHKTAATPALLGAVRAPAGRSPCAFALLVPRPYWDPDTDEAALRRDLPHRVQSLGLDVTVVTVRQLERAVSDVR